MMHTPAAILRVLIILQAVSFETSLFSKSFRIAPSRSPLRMLYSLNPPTKTLRLAEGPLQNVLYVNLSQNGGAVIVGGRNALYRLSPSNFSTSAIYKTGPVIDSVFCPPYPLACDYDRNRTTADTYNRVLLQLGTDPFVLACGTTSQGMCSIHDLLKGFNVTENMNNEFKDNYVASKDSTVAFFGTGINQNVLFAASTYDGRPFGYHQYAVSARTLNDSGFFSLLSSNGTKSSFVNVVQGLKTSHRIFYLYGFSHNGFAYFVTIRRKVTLWGGYRTWLARVCESDKSFRTYMEVPIQCPRDPQFLLATRAVVGPSGAEGNVGRKILAVAFKKEKQTRSLFENSVLCFFDMTSVENAFNNVVAGCSMGKPSANLSPLYHKNDSGLDCKPDEPRGDMFCTPGKNSYIESSMPLIGRTKVTLLRKLVTSLTITQQNGTTVVWMGDSHSFLHKFVLLNDSVHHLVALNLSKVGSKGISRSTAIDDSGTYGYFIIGEKVVQIPVGSCRIYDRCSHCMRSRDDPLRCGWCGDHCAHFAECPHPEKFAFGRCPIEFVHHLPMSSDRTLGFGVAPSTIGGQVAKIYPTNGSSFGGTSLTIEGDNLGSPDLQPDSSIEVLVGGKKCEIVKWTPKRVLCTTPVGRDASKVDIVVRVNDTYRSSVKKHNVVETAIVPSGFQYKVPGFSSITPVYDPVSGYTHVTITGSNLDIGSQQAVKVGKSICGIKRINGTFLECSTNGVDGDQVEQGMQVLLTIDGAQVPYVAPVHSSSEPTINARAVIDDIEPKRSTYCGRFTLAVKGAHLDRVSNPVMVTRVTSLNGTNHEEIKKACEATENGTRMLCPGTPLVEFSVISVAEMEASNLRILAQVSFQTEDVHLPSGLSGGRRYFTLVYEPPPQFDRFPEGILKVDPNEPVIEITGKHFDILKGSDHLFVRVNGLDHRCNFINTTSSSVICKLTRDILVSGSSHTFEVVYAAQSYALGDLMLAAQESSFDSDLVSAAVVVVVLVALFVAGICLLWLRYRRSKRTSHSVHLASFDNDDAGRCAGNSYVKRTGPAAQESSFATIFELDEETKAMLERENLLLKREHLHLGIVIGQGHFGCVYCGTLKVAEKERDLYVAVKTLRNSSRGGEQDSRAFLEEALMMKNFRHVNVLKLIGLTVDKRDGLLVITPYMKYGDLLSYIRDENNEPTVKQLITFGVHVAEGMNYLAGMKFVHRDLAARNCMLSEDFIVRVADFGLSRDIYEKDYYSSDNKTKLPVRWMAPESLEKGIYNHKTDVWSYGVVLWELITRGVTPYPDVDNWDIINFLKRGRRMQQPDFCPKELYTIMLQCWHNDPKMRPSFKQLTTEVPSIFTSLEEGKRDRRVSLNVTYVNCPNLYLAKAVEPSTEPDVLSDSPPIRLRQR